MKPRGPTYTAAERIEIANKIFSLTELCFKDWKIKKQMTLIEATEQVGIHYQTFQKWLASDKMIADMNIAHKNNRLAHMRHQAKWQVELALYGQLKLKDKERVDIALRFLEKVDEDFKDRKEITIEGNDFSVAMEDLENKARILIKELKPNDNK